MKVKRIFLKHLNQNVKPYNFWIIKQNYLSLFFFEERIKKHIIYRINQEYPFYNLRILFFYMLMLAYFYWHVVTIYSNIKLHQLSEKSPKIFSLAVCILLCLSRCGAKMFRGGRVENRWSSSTSRSWFSLRSFTLGRLSIWSDQTDLVSPRRHTDPVM